MFHSAFCFFVTVLYALYARPWFVKIRMSASSSFYSNFYIFEKSLNILCLQETHFKNYFCAEYYKKSWRKSEHLNQINSVAIFVDNKIIYNQLKYQFGNNSNNMLYAEKNLFM